LFPEFTDQATIVYWDQLGCGINNHKINEEFTIDIFINMTIDLIKQLKQDFKDNTISLFGMSWGSILAAKAADAVPELIHNVLVYGQVLKHLPFNDDVYEVLQKSSISNKNKEKLLDMRYSSTHTYKDLKTLLSN
jgi:pimeloyl-ACP methyl ester carboxylesterase